MARSGSLDVWVSVRLPGQLAERVRDMARVRRTTVSAVIRGALEEQEKTQRLAAKLEQVLEALQRNSVWHLAVPAAEAQTNPGEPMKNGTQETPSGAPSDSLPMDEEMLDKSMRAMLAAFGGDEE